MFSGHALACSKQLLNLIAPFRTSPLSCCQPFLSFGDCNMGINPSTGFHGSQKWQKSRLTKPQENSCAPWQLHTSKM